MVAIVVSDEVQVTDVVMSRLALLEYVPLAVSRLAVPGAMLESAGTTVMAVRVPVNKRDIPSFWVPHAKRRAAIAAI
jgi:hypothetical protein